uniref:Spi-2 proto-oncogene n=1 Tax=Oncorhynchus kisutch TaxID=8019 RepID=A0A8C7KYE9_ONCKI
MEGNSDLPLTVKDNGPIHRLSLYVLHTYNFTTEHHHSWSSQKGIFIINYDGILLTAPLYLIIVTVVTGRKVCLFHFLFEMLENLGMAHCVSWVPVAADGGFRFSSRNKEQVAALWGQRKGNRRPMTYQKMSRALRNHTQSGEIFKVKKKLTYQFSRPTLSALRKCHQGKL